MANRVMFVQLKSGYALDEGPSWIALVKLNKTWKTATFHGRTLRRAQLADANFYDVENGDEYWISGPKRDRTDTRYGHRTTLVEDDIAEVYDAFLDGIALPGCERG